MCETQRRTVSSNSRFRTVLLEQYSANISPEQDPLDAIESEYVCVCLYIHIYIYIYIYIYANNITHNKQQLGTNNSLDNNLVKSLQDPLDAIQSLAQTTRNTQHNKYNIHIIYKPSKSLQDPLDAIE